MRCSWCGSLVLSFMGTLGMLDWYRCRACGMDHSEPGGSHGSDTDVDDMDGDQTYAYAYA